MNADEAIALLPEGETIHTMLGGGGFMCGADWSRDALLDAIRKSPTLRRSGEFASAIGHGLAVNHNGSWLFVETVKEPQP